MLPVLASVPAVEGHVGGAAHFWCMQTQTLPRADALRCRSVLLALRDDVDVPVVFGPDRPEAARAAFESLAHLNARISGRYCYTDAPEHILRMRDRARALAGAYGEYAPRAVGAVAELGHEHFDRWPLGAT